MTLIDSQFELMRVIRPAQNFEALYQGQDGDIPIAFPGDLDPRANQDGYAATLGSGIRVPGKGSHLKIWIPQIINATGESFTPSYDYSYQINWRLRNMPEYAENAASRRGESPPFSLRARFDGYQGASSARRVLIPGGADILLYEQTESGTDGAPGVVNVRVQRYVPMVNQAALPLAPGGGNLIWQQGVYQGASTEPELCGATFAVFDVEAQGDEMCIYAFKNDPDDEWDFAGNDEPFSYTYGSDNGSRTPLPQIGIMITAGTSSS